jgi:hypothetical protein
MDEPIRASVLSEVESPAALAGGVPFGSKITYFLYRLGRSVVYGSFGLRDTLSRIRIGRRSHVIFLAFSCLAATVALNYSLSVSVSAAGMPTVSVPVMTDMGAVVEDGKAGLPKYSVMITISRPVSPARFGRRKERHGR